MAFEGLADRLQQTMQKIRGKGKVSEADVKEMMREVRLALLEADVNFKVVKDFVKADPKRKISFYYRDLNHGAWIGINENEKYTPSSLLKVTIMIAYFKEAESN